MNNGSESAFPIQMPIDQYGNPTGPTVRGLTKRSRGRGAYCDYTASLRQEQDMPGHSVKQTQIGSFAQAAYDRNWR